MVDYCEPLIFDTVEEMENYIIDYSDKLKLDGTIIYVKETKKAYLYDGEVVREISKDESSDFDYNFQKSYNNDIAFVYDNLLNEFESYQNKISRRTTFIFVLILILIISILITIYGNYNRDIQLLQEIDRLEQKIEFLEEEKSEEQNILEFM